MSEAKLHIDFRQGILQVEGDVFLVREIYGDFKGRMQGMETIFPANMQGDVSVVKQDASSLGLQKNTEKPRSAQKKGSSTAIKETYEVVKEFYSGEDGKSFLVEMKGYTNPASHQKKVTLFIYLMQKVGVENITVNHVFTCYRLLTDKTPEKLKQAITDAKNKRAWIINDSWEDLKVHHKGEEMVEHELILREDAA